jgi:hypothetical protein
MINYYISLIFCGALRKKAEEIVSRGYFFHATRPCGSTGVKYVIPRTLLHRALGSVTGHAQTLALQMESDSFKWDII